MTSDMAGVHCDFKDWLCTVYVGRLITTTSDISVN